MMALFGVPYRSDRRVPAGVATIWYALATGMANAGTVVLGFVIGGATLAFPIVMLIVKSKPYFRQDAVA